MDKITVSAIVHTRNSSKTLDQCLSSLRWVNELIIVDMHSQDNSLEIARQYTNHIYHQAPVSRVDGIRNEYLNFVTSEWTLVIDSDEFLSEDAEHLISQTIQNYAAEYDAFRLPRYNRIGDQVMRGSGWSPDPQLRLFRKNSVLWSDTNHNIPRVSDESSRIKILEGPSTPYIHHQNYRDLRHFIHKQLEYALNDIYEQQPESFDFGSYVNQAYGALAWRGDTQNDGELSHALSLVMAWDQLMRGLIHWDSLNPRPPLDELLAMPIQSKPDES
ncbi:MAG: glycosyltransferase involved in cell wall biosynthesis [Parasphingorhabdus sp.]|jgi:glycosyltransferase involved in cell wall biosynthesis